MKTSLLPLARREARAIRVPVLGALALGTIVALWMFSSSPPGARFQVIQGNRTAPLYFGLGALLGVVLAWLQVEQERRDDTWTGYWLLPFSRARLVAAKLASGAVGIALGAALPALVLAGLVAFTSHRGGPMDPRGWLMPPLVFLGGVTAYACGWIASLRTSASLFGTRLVPLGSAAIMLFIAAALADKDRPLVSIAVLAFSAALTVAVAAALAARPSTNRLRGETLGVIATFHPVVVVLSIIAVESIASNIDRPTERFTSSYHTLDEHGWAVEVTHDAAGRRTTVALDGSRVAVEPLRTSGTQLDEMRNRDWLTSSIHDHRERVFWDPASRVLRRFDATEGDEIGCAGRDGFAADDCAPFAEALVNVYDRERGSLLVFGEGAYRVDWVRQEVALESERPLRAILRVFDDPTLELHWFADAVEARRVDGRLVASCASSPAWVRMEAGLTVDGALAILGANAAEERVARRCAVDGSVAETNLPPYARARHDWRKDALAVAFGPSVFLFAGVTFGDRDFFAAEWLWALTFAAALAAALGTARAAGARLGALAFLLVAALGPGALLGLAALHLQRRSTSINPVLAPS
jgi:hypothetical protein